MSMLTFSGEIQLINEIPIIRIPLEISMNLPSRGMVMVEGTIEDQAFWGPLEPDGAGSHWYQIPDELFKQAKSQGWNQIQVQLSNLDTWIEPLIPADLEAALIKAAVLDEWNQVTTKAKWEWIRWIRFTNQIETRNKRIAITCSKLSSGKKRPCCFDQSRCTITSVSKSGVLLP